MNEDWRLRVDFEKEGLAGHLIDHLGAAELEHDLSTAYEDRVIVSRDGDRVFLYAGTKEQIRAAQGHVEQLANTHSWPIKVELRHWHALAEDWEDPDVPLPESEAERRAEHDKVIADERREEADRGYPEFEVRLDFDSRHEAAEAAKTLREEGVQPVHRSSYLLVGATDEDSAKELADQFRGQLPAAKRVTTEGTLRAAWAERPANPFAIFGGLGG